MRVSPRRVALRYASAKTAGRVLDFGRRSVRPKHTIKINGNTYALSDYAGSMLSDYGDDDEDSGGAQIIRGPAHSQPYRYLWIYDSDRGDLGMFRVTDGSEKVWGRAYRMVREIMLLDRKGELNRVSNAEALSITRAMRKKEDEASSDLKSWAKELETDYQRFVNQVAADVFEAEIVPEIERRVAEVNQGVVPFGFQVVESLLNHGKSAEEQARGHVVTQALEGFTTEMIDDEIRRRGVDPDEGDIQASYWALNDIREEAWDRFVPENEKVALRYAATAIPGGIARDMSPSDFDQDELKAGIKVEQEHLIGGGYSKAEARAKAQDIAMDHLAEIPDYYTRLKKMESDADR